MSPAPLDRLKGILLDPRHEWPKIALEPATLTSLYVGWVMLLAGIGPVSALVAGGVAELKFAIGSYVTALIVTFILAAVIDALAPAFGGDKEFVLALKLVAYAYTAAWVAGIFNLFGLPGRVVALTASIYAWYTLYLGAPVLKKCAPDKAAPFTVVVVICGIALGLLFTYALAGLGFLPGRGPGLPR